MSVQIGAALIAAGADVNVQDNGGQSPLFRATLFGNTSFVRALVTAKADQTLKTEDGEVAVDKAREGGCRGHPDILAIFEGRSD
jgi:ankyrin repeat protein